MLAGAAQLVLGHRLLAQALELGADHVQRLDDVVLAGADVDPDLPGVLVLARPGVDGVGQAPLLADLLEQARGGGAAQDRVQDRQGEAALVVAGDALSAQADVVLLGLLAVKGDALAAAARSRRRRSRGSVPDAVGEPLAGQALDLGVLEVAGRRDHDRAGDITGVVIGGHLVHGQGADHVATADHRPAQRMVTEDRLGQDVVHLVLRLVLVHGDLLEHHLALGLEVRVGRAQQHVAHHLERALEVLVEEVGVQDRRLLAGGCVHLRAEAVELLRDLLGGQLRRALEQHVLEEVRDAGL